MAQPIDIIELLDQLQLSPNYQDEGRPSSLIPKPPGDDPRIKAIQQYMQMKGASSMPRFGTPQEMSYGGKKVPLSRKSLGQMKEDLGTQAMSDYDKDTAHEYFKTNNPEQLRQIFTDRAMELPEYVTSQGRPSPNQSDPSLSGQMGRAAVKTMPVQEPLRTKDFWDEDHQLSDPAGLPKQYKNEMLGRGETEQTDEELLRFLHDAMMNNRAGQNI